MISDTHMYVSRYNHTVHTHSLYCTYIRMYACMHYRVSFGKMGKGGGGGGGQNKTYEKMGPIKFLNLYPQRCIFRLICGSQMT